jgi:hypothetical protein
MVVIFLSLQQEMDGIIVSDPDGTLLDRNLRSIAAKNSPEGLPMQDNLSSALRFRHSP